MVLSRSEYDKQVTLLRGTLEDPRPAILAFFLEAKSLRWQRTTRTTRGAKKTLYVLYMVQSGTWTVRRTSRTNKQAAVCDDAAQWSRLGRRRAPLLPSQSRRLWPQSLNFSRMSMGGKNGLVWRAHNTFLSPHRTWACLVQRWSRRVDDKKVDLQVTLVCLFLSLMFPSSSQRAYQHHKYWPPSSSREPFCFNTPRRRVTRYGLELIFSEDPLQ